MKKSIIAASAASLALAAMPVVSTFANTNPQTLTDNFTVNLNSTCTITRTGASGSTSTGITAAGAWTPGDPEGSSEGTYAVTMDAGASAHLGTSTFTIVCNDTSSTGHNLTVKVTGLSSTSNAAAIAAPISYDGSTNHTVGTNAGNYWNITTAAGTGTLPGFSAGIVAMPTSGEHTDTQTIYSSTDPGVVVDATFTAAYKVSTTTAQPSGSYSGSALYTLTHGA